MKVLKFKEHLSKLILDGEKNTTWRLFDDKDISVGDIILFLVSETKEEFTKAKIVSVKKTTLGELTNEDLKGHEKFLSDEEMYQTYSKYYNRSVDKDTSVKIIKFNLEQ